MFNPERITVKRNGNIFHSVITHIRPKEAYGCSTHSALSDKHGLWLCAFACAFWFCGIKAQRTLPGFGAHYTICIRNPPNSISNYLCPYSRLPHRKPQQARQAFSGLRFKCLLLFVFVGFRLGNSEIKALQG